LSDLVKTQIKGLRELGFALKKIEDRIYWVASVDLTKKTAQTIARAARKKVPEKTRNLRKAIRTVRVAKKARKSVVYHVGITVGKKAKHDGFYWRFVEFGTIGPYKIPSDEHDEKGNVLKINTTFVGGQVTHPGSQKHPFMRPAFDEYWEKGLQKGIKSARKLIERPIKSK
jgi:HK97 gp10 family phage protein